MGLPTKNGSNSRTATEVPGRNHNNDKRELTNGHSTAILLPSAALGLGSVDFPLIDFAVSS